LSEENLITAERVRELVSYDPETGLFFWRQREHGPRAGTQTGKPRHDGYCRVFLDGRSYLAHRLAWLITYDVWPAVDVDHIDGNPSNNRIANLRSTSRSQNLYNQKLPVNNKTGRKGVCFDPARGLYAAYITVGKKRIPLGRFAKLETAIEVRAEAEKKYHGEFARAV
jgi:hypothetical protein